MNKKILYAIIIIIILLFIFNFLIQYSLGTLTKCWGFSFGENKLKKNGKGRISPRCLGILFPFYE
ncbi:MAG: hypothetical protein A2909_02025 [Candidatus Tagabacteria bacterium RIFCSPLOWO2_01_FULL_39_11]|uniref:Uncharacterized protein n=1 Tax=Candidatus Tagabacteria bacterium RIFCSPLOWO2_01_FULL_39_11 TaxID=1802295 RepID=A0A1G2LQ86_9BACT|nr:MAG: hypothetical protein A2909_02025 [Candidatus Tagabacteria bacterium RIFCSPLOWO2_01_FULL_39_11]